MRLWTCAQLDVSSGKDAHHQAGPLAGVVCAPPLQYKNKPIQSCRAGEDTQAAGENADPEGLAEYGADAELPEALLGAAAAYSGVGIMTRDPDPALLETLAGLHRLLAGRHLATVQEWLRVLVKVLRRLDDGKQAAGSLLPPGPALAYRSLTMFSMWPGWLFRTCCIIRCGCK